MRWLNILRLLNTWSEADGVLCIGLIDIQLLEEEYISGLTLRFENLPIVPSMLSASLWASRCELSLFLQPTANYYL